MTSLNAAKAAEVISLLEPSIVIPMHYEMRESLIKLDPLSKFLKEMGLNEVETVETIKFASRKSLPDDIRVIVLDKSL